MLITAGVVWIIAGGNILRIGIMTWLTDSQYWLFKIGEATVVFLLFFLFVFKRLYYKHTKRIGEKKKEKNCPFSFFDVKGWIIMVFMITFGITMRSFHILPDAFISVFYTGLSLALMFSLVEIGSLILQRAINDFGTKTIAAHTAARKISSILMLPYTAFGSACATYCSQNIGANRPDRAGKGVKSSILMAWVWSAAAVIIGYIFSPYIVSWIAGTDEQYIVDLASKYMRVNTPFYFVLAVLIVLRSSLQGLGRKAVPVASSIIEMVGKAVIAFTAAPALGYFGVMISEPIVWIFMTILLIIGYASDKQLMEATFGKKKISS